MLYPMKFYQIYKSAIWGGRGIERVLKKSIPEGSIAESWEICCRQDGMSIISNGYLKDFSLNKVILQYKETLLGTHVFNQSYTKFPLLIKLIDANDKLSIQVHPGDEYAEKHYTEGKNELWYVIDAKPGAQIIYGFKNGISKHEFEQSIINNNIESLLNIINVTAGDVIYIPAGTIHAILDGILIAEIQQNSNTTYRIYDWNRPGSDGKPRELHISNALDVIDFDCPGSLPMPAIINSYDGYNIKALPKYPYFNVDEITVLDKYSDTTDGTKFSIYFVLFGSGTVKYDKGSDHITMGDTILIPASLSHYDIIGPMKLLKIQP